MTDEETQAGVYHLKGPGIEVSYRPSDHRLDITGEQDLLKQDVDARATVLPEGGLHVTATLLESSRNGTRVILTLLLPEVSWTPETGGEPTAVTGVATVTSLFKDVLGGPPPVLQRYKEVRQLEGTVSPAG